MLTSKRSWYLAVLALILAVAGVLKTATVDWTAVDSRSTLLVSQSIVRTGSIRLDDLSAKQIAGYRYTVHKKRGHYYGYFPLGSSVLAVPVVAVLQHFGFDVAKREDDRRAQHIVVFGIQISTVILLLCIARLYLERVWALAVAGAFWFGTTFSSTNGAALWSHGFAVLFALGAIYALLRTNAESRYTWLGLGLALFLAYFCRPTLALLVPAALLTVWFHNRAAAIRAALLFSVCMLGFVAFSWQEFRQVLPDYYLPARLAKNRTFWTALEGNLVSPSRGLFVFSPLLLTPLLFLSSVRSAFRTNPHLVWIGLLWPVAHMLAISRFPHWWAGYSFGPRFCTDALPGLYVLLCATLQHAERAHPKRLAAVFALLALPSCWIHSYQGMYNRSTRNWNGGPIVDKHPEFVFDWRYPQFLHTRERHERRLKEYAQWAPKKRHKRARAAEPGAK